MPCFCTVPADVARARFNVGIPVLLPPPPALRLTAALPLLAAEPRLDVQIATGLEAMRLPSLDLGGGPLMQVAVMISMMSGTFTFDDLPMLEAQMAQAADSFSRNIWPRLGWLTTFRMQPLLNMALIARLVIDLTALGIDPFSLGAPPPAPAISSFRFALARPQLQMARLLGTLPALPAMMLALDLPPLGETGAVPALANWLDGLASLSPPKLIIPYPVILKLAMVLESLATIQEAFGAVSPATVQRLDAMLRMWSTFPLPVPLPALALSEKLALLPPMEDIRLGERAAGQAGATMATAFSPPRLAIAPFLNVMLALQASLNLAVDLEPFDQCAMCPCA
ncbi:hypothetical protein [Oceanicella sp. SM1341]|uniref:hypothetical protein n=1 Tax=Oceanicella sp. SM1341 TaxID=1548889 RepID=UPI000E4C9A4A|nr:hypothetical protein [Oceanicella sp. SM1341]